MCRRERGEVSECVCGGDSVCKRRGRREGESDRVSVCERVSVCVQERERE